MVEQSIRKTQTDRIVFVLTVFLLSCFVIFEKYTWGKYAFLIDSGLIFLIDMTSSPKKSILTIEKIHKYFGLFVIFCFASVIWAINRSNAIEWSRTLLNNLICITLIYPYYSKKKDVSMLLSVIMWSSYIIAIYTIWFYGLDRLFASSYTQYVRLGNDFSNINTVGMFCAFGLIIQIENIMNFKRIRWHTVFSIPAIIVVAATQSRKAVTMLLVGILLISFLRNSNKRNVIKTVFKIIGIIIAVLIALFIVSKISIFSGVTERLNQLISGITGTGEYDSGTINRQNYVELGIKTWLQYPLGGVGINCPRIINQSVFGEYVYLHNNFVELLCGVGIVGFIIYYSMYYYIIKSLIKNKSKNRRYFIIGITWALLLLIMDYGMVSYYSKLQAFYFMILFINIKCLSNYKDDSVDYKG